MSRWALREERAVLIAIEKLSVAYDIRLAFSLLPEHVVKIVGYEGKGKKE